MDKSETDALIERIRAEYLEMPGMTLRAEQVARLCGLEPSKCLGVLDVLVGTQFLRRKADGAYIRRSGEPTLPGTRGRPVPERGRVEIAEVASAQD